jgi:hypothetical protein
MRKHLPMGMRPEPPTGYSGTPLAKKLGYRVGLRVFLAGAPSDYLQWLDPLPPGIVFERHLNAAVDLVHVFEFDKAGLGRFLADARLAIKPDASIWVSWPKRASKVSTTITEDTVRELALPLGLVDIKVCAVSEVWSGLKLVVRKALR